MESIIFDKICSYFSSRNLLTAAQHGFRQKESTVSNSLELLDDINKLVDSGNCVDMITVDFSKAFDIIWHNKLPFKLSKYGVTDKLLYCIHEFLIGRSFNVCVNSCVSKLFNVCSSVPQGSKWGSLLYILFTNYITQIFNFARIKMYADDLTIYAIINNNNNDRIELQNELDLFYEWCSNGASPLILRNVKNSFWSL